MLQMKEILNAIKKKYYEIIEHTADWTAEKRNPQIQRWLNWLAKLIGSIKNQKMKKILQKIKNEMTEKKKRKRRRNDDDDDDDDDE